MDLPFKDIPAASTIIGAFACIKTLDEDGKVCWYHRYSDDLSQAEALGQAQVMKHQLLRDILEGWEDDDG